MQAYEGNNATWSPEMHLVQEFRSSKLRSAAPSLILSTLWDLEFPCYLASHSIDESLYVNVVN